MSCIEHTGHLDKRGYGQKKYRGKVVFAHRLAYALANGLDVFTMGGHVLHACDNPKCINPEHLSLGTHAENMLDMVRKGRAYAKVSLEQAAYIRLEFRPFIKGVQKSNAKILADKYGVHRSTIESVARGNVRSASTY